jgi:chromosome segregation ATPase
MNGADRAGRIATALKTLKYGNDALEKECQELQTELGSINAQRSVMERRLQEMNAKAEEQRRIEAQNQELQDQIDDLDDDYQCETDRLMEVKRIFELTVNELCKERNKRKRIQEKTKKIVENLRALTQIADSLRPKPEQLKQNEKLAKKLEDKRVSWKQNKAELQSLVQDLQQKRDAALEEAKNFQIQIDDRVGLIEELEAKVQRRNQSIADLERTLQSHLDERQALLGDFDALKQEVDSMTRKSQGLKEALIKAASVVATNKKKCQKETDKLRTTKARLQQLQVNFAEKLKTMKAEAEQQTNEKTQELQKIEAQKDDEIRQLQEELKTAKEQSDEAAARLKKLEAERAADRRKFTDAKTGYERDLQQLQRIMIAMSDAKLNPVNN